MNERIRDLYEQACDIERENELAIKPYKDRVVITFAELIIKECAGIADTEYNVPGCGYITKTKGMRIKEHFGVES